MNPMKATNQATNQRQTFHNSGRQIGGALGKQVGWTLLALLGTATGDPRAEKTTTKG